MPSNKPKIIGLYGLPGAGKSYLLSQLREVLTEQDSDSQPFAFYEGSDVIQDVTPGGLAGFRALTKDGQGIYRKLAVEKITTAAQQSGSTAVVTGHYMFWPVGTSAGEVAWTDRDAEMYTHILYLDVPVDVIWQRRRSDRTRKRELASVMHLQRWKSRDVQELEEICREHSVLFVRVDGTVERVEELAWDFAVHDEKRNFLRVEQRLDDLIEAVEKPGLETFVVTDADRTLTAVDTGRLLWQEIKHHRNLAGDAQDPFEILFNSPLKYSYTAFRQATMLYEELATQEWLEAVCDKVAAKVEMYPEFVCLLRRIAGHGRVGAVVVTCGLRSLWQKILERHGLSQSVEVIGGGRIADNFVVTPEVKGAVIDRLRHVHHKYVWAFGDSPLDIDMLCKADQAIVVVGEEHHRSTSMDEELEKAIDNRGLTARQVLLPSHVSPRLDTNRLPVVSITATDFVDQAIANHRVSEQIGLDVVHATNTPAAHLLSTPTRDASISGPALRAAHHRMGWYLAIEHLTRIIGLEDCPIPHVQGHHTSGHRLAHERETTIIALMRGGEPMALGISDVFPQSMFVHAKEAEDVKSQHVSGQKTVILVDSVVNSGKSVAEFAHRIRQLDAMVRIVVAAGVVQEGAVAKDGSLVRLLGAGVSVVALRLSDNKFVGSGGTDTGNRLFDTTHLA